MKDTTPSETLPVDATTMGAAPIARSIGRFVVMEVLGQGAMGLVLAAYDPDLDRKVAVKLLRPDAYDAGSREGRERMLREARALAKLSHPNVIAIHEVGTADDRIFLAMEFAPGGTLRSWLSSEKRPWRDALAKVVQAGRGLAAAHEAGLVHRDFKPSNVLLARNGDARVADFGLVASAIASEGASHDRDLDLTQSGALLGTPAYMAPEQHDPTCGEIGPAADQFAFCVTAWEAVHGQPPFDGTTLQTLGMNVLANRIVDPPAGSDAPAWVRTILRRGLSVAPEERWPSMTALLDELARDPIAERRGRRRRFAMAGLAIAFVGGTTALAVTRSADSGPQCDGMDRGLVGVWDPARQAALRDAFAMSGNPRAGDLATRVIAALDAYARSWVTARRTACEATHVHGDQSPELLDLRIACLDRALVDADALVDRFVDSPTSTTVDKSLGAALRLSPLSACDDNDAMRAVAPLPADPASRARVAEIRTISAAAKALGEVGQAKAGRQHAITAAAEAEQLGHRGLIAEVLGRRGRLEQLTGDFAAAEATVREAIYAAADAHDDRAAAMLWGQLLYLIAEPQQRPVDALRLVPAAEAAMRRAGRDRELVAAQQAAIGRVLVANGKLSEGKQMLETSLAMKSEIHGRESFEVARELGAIGNVLQDLGEHDASIGYLERALAIWTRTFGPDHPDVIAMEANIANANEAKGAYEEAVRRHRRVLDGFARALGPEHPHVASSHVNLANALAGMNQLDEAIANYEQAIELQTKILGPDHANLAMANAALAHALFKRRRLDDASRTAQRAIEIYEALQMSDNPLIAYPLETIALVSRDAGTAVEGIAPAERSLAIRVAVGAGPEPVAASKLTLGSVLLVARTDRARGLALVHEARAYYATLGDAGAPFVEEADIILAKHTR